MANDRFASADELVKEYAEIEAKMADPTIHEDANNARKLGRRYAQLGPVVSGYRVWRAAEDDLAAGREMAADDADFAAEIPALEEAALIAGDKLEELLLPRDPNDDRDVILEVKAGAGGDESALFAGDLLRMYMRYAEKRNWKVEILDADGKPLKLLVSGKSTTIRVSFDSHLPIKQPVVGIRFHHLLGPVIWGTNTRRRGAFIESIAGPGHVDITIPELPLLEGTYDLTVALTDQHETYEYDHWERRVRFDVVQYNSFDEGLIQINANWV